MALCERLLERGVFAQGIRPPTVPEGSSRLRFTVMATHRDGELKQAARRGRRSGARRSLRHRASRRPPPAARRRLAERPWTGVFVTGTGTEVGKTVVAAAIARTLAAAGERVAVFKPAVTGLDETGRARPRAAAPRRRLERRRDERSPPTATARRRRPHLAAELAGEEIDPARLRRRRHAPRRRAPTRSSARASAGCSCRSRASYLVRDLAGELGLPLVVAASPGLGTINHTLLTIEAARAAGLEVAAVVLTPWPEAPSRVEESNRETIASLGGVRVETLPRLDLADPRAPGQHFAQRARCAG